MRPGKIFPGLLFAVVFLAVGLTLVFPSSPWSPLHSSFNTITTLSVIIVLAILAFFFEFDDRISGSRELSLVASLGAVSAVSRVVFAALPGFQPATFLIICSGYIFGSVAGFMVGALTAIISNLLLGHGPWTLFQIFAWGMGGALIGLLKGGRLNRYHLAVFGFAWAYVFGLIMNLWYLAGFGFPVSLKSVVGLQLASLWMDALHAVGTALLMLFFGSRVIKILERFRDRTETVFQQPPSK